MWVLTYNDHHGEKKWVGAGRTGVQECTAPYLGYFYKTKEAAEEAAFWVIYRWKHLIGKIHLERFDVPESRLAWIDTALTTAILWGKESVGHRNLGRGTA
jgi:hypothetical protein